MTVRRVVLLVGAVLLVVGIIGLLVPVTVSEGDAGSVGCGRALVPDMSQAQDRDNQPENKAAQATQDIPILNQLAPKPTHFTQDCHNSVSSRQWWTIPLAVIGAIAVIASFFVRGGRAGVAGG